MTIKLEGVLDDIARLRVPDLDRKIAEQFGSYHYGVGGALKRCFVKLDQIPRRTVLRYEVLRKGGSTVGMRAHPGDVPSPGDEFTYGWPWSEFLPESTARS